MTVCRAGLTLKQSGRSEKMRARTVQVLVFDIYVGYSILFENRPNILLIFGHDDVHEALSYVERHIASVIPPQQDFALRIVTDIRNVNE
jgi:hypothetical protein